MECALLALHRWKRNEPAFARTVPAAITPPSQRDKTHNKLKSRDILHLSQLIKVFRNGETERHLKNRRGRQRDGLGRRRKVAEDVASLEGVVIFIEGFCGHRRD